MQLFSYEALDNAGQRKTGTIEAVSRVAALKRLGFMGLSPSKLEEAPPMPVPDFRSVSHTPHHSPSRETRAPIPIVCVSGGTRILNLVIDTAACFVLSFILCMIIILPFVVLTDSSSTSRSEKDTLFYLLMCLIMMLTPPLYYVIFEGIWGRTLGKMVSGTIVVYEYGRKANFGQVLGRTLARLIPFDWVSCFGSQSRAWHDSIAGTYVVENRRPRPAVPPSGRQLPPPLPQQ